MKKLVLFLLVTVSLMAWESGEVVTVIDGDTIMLKKSDGTVKKCRLVGLDTFETSINHRTFIQLETLQNIYQHRTSTIRDVLKFGHQAKKFVEKRVLHKNVKYHSYKKFDKYDRELIYLKNINYLLIRNGLAIQYPNNLMHKDRKAFLLEASREANLENRGIYSLKRGK